MDPENQELSELRQLIARLTERVYRLERAAGIESPAEIRATPERVEVPKPPVMAVEEQPVPPAPAPSTFASLPQQGSELDTDDLESKIGSQWLNRVGIAALLIGVSFFLKYAFENNWIGPSGRIAIGLLAGIAI